MFGMDHVVAMFRDPVCKNNRTTTSAGDSRHREEQMIDDELDTFETLNEVDGM
jgi:hypothetical protein